MWRIFVCVLTTLVLSGNGESVRAAEGDLDPSFGNGGKKIIQIAAQQRDFANTVAVQPDGKIVVGGELGDFSLDSNRSVLVRLNADGSLDPSFGNGGKIINPGQLHLPALAIQPDGKIVTAGATTVQSITLDFAVVRYNADGSLDQSFGNGGYAVNGAGNAESLVLQPDGKIILVGFLPIFRNGSDYLLARFNPDGSPDQTFGDGGRVTTSFSSGLNSGDKALAAALQPDGKIVATGYASGVSAVLVRYNSNGSVDTSFGLDGFVFAPNFGAIASRILLQPDGKIVVGGGGFVLGRYNANGTTDQSFGSSGRVSGGFGSGSGALYGLARQPDGKLLAGGSVSYSGTGECVFALSRYTPNGSLDPTFGNNGFVLTNLTVGTLDQAFSLTLQPDGKPVLAGYAAEPGGSYHDFAVTRHIGAMELTAAVSRKTHGNAGAFDINLPLAGTPAVECRDGLGNHTLVFTFSHNVTGGSASITEGVATVAGSPTYSGRTVTVNLAGVDNGQTISVMLSNVTDASGQTLSPRTVRMSVLLGDTAANNVVNSSDVAQTKANIGAPLNAANFRCDLTVNGIINSSDIGLVKAASGGGASANPQR